ncbi:hypothetical protein CRYUN_Cryun34aG0055100 [Craigia yunnanensis]
MEKKKYPVGPEYYILHEEVGQGFSASVLSVYPSMRLLQLKFLILNVITVICIQAILIAYLSLAQHFLLDKNNISREAQIMILVDHPNVLKSHCSFVSDHNLWVVMPNVAGGSCLHILKAAYPDGFEEVVIATVLCEVLKGLEYLHHHGHIHRDVKAGNILIDARGAIKLGDFGVSACIFYSGDRQRMRNTFVGTPCWMAPEVMEQLHGYDFKADIWSFGITALELAHGHAPFSKYPPMTVLIMTLQNAPPGLDYERDRKFSKLARSNDYIARTLLDGLPALGDQIPALKRKEEDMLAQKKVPDGEKDELSQNEYKRGISGWNFNLEDMKAQASLVQDEDLISDTIQGGSSGSLSTLDGQDKQSECKPLLKLRTRCYRKVVFISFVVVWLVEDNDLVQNQPAPFVAVEPTINIAKVRFERSDDDSRVASPSAELNVISPCHDDHVESNLCEKSILELSGKSFDNMNKPSHQRTATFLRSPSIPEIKVLPIKGESNKQNQPQNISGGNGAVVLLEERILFQSFLLRHLNHQAMNIDDLDEKAKPPVVQQRGRFKVTSENVDLEKVVASPVLQKSHSMQVGTSEVLTANPVVSLAPPSDVATSTPAAHHHFPLLQSVLQTNILQRENILNLMTYVSAGDSTGAKIDASQKYTFYSSLL